MTPPDASRPDATPLDPPAKAASAGAALPARCVWVAAACLLVFVSSQYARLGAPLFWQDEAETAMFGRRILEYGYPKVHGEEGVVYGMSVPMAFATDADSDAYTGSLWAQYYVAAAGVALSDLADGLHERTALVRLPFALLGSAGLALAWLAFAPVFVPRTRRWGMGSAYCLGLAASISLQLHVREVRYYALVVFCVGGLLFVKQRASGPGRLAGLFFGLLLLFNSFYPAAVAMGGWIVGEALWSALRARARSAVAVRAVALEIAPVVAVAVAVIPIAIGFDMLGLSRLMSARYHFGIGDYLANLTAIARHLAVHEFAVAALLLRAAAALLARRSSTPSLNPSLSPPLSPSLSPSLWRLVLIWVLVGARNPIFFERYFVALGPVLLLAALLDFDRIRDQLAGVFPDDKRHGRAVVGVVGLCVMISFGVKESELDGRIAELGTPVVGPLDVAIPWVAARFDTPQEIVVATNYEAEAWMFYLGSRVVGRFHDGSEADAQAEAAARPDVVVLRRGYPHTAAKLRAYLTAGDFERHELDAADLPYNTIPELSAGRVLKLTHPFRTIRPRHAGEALWVWLRRTQEEAGR